MCAWASCISVHLHLSICVFVPWVTVHLHICEPIFGVPYVVCDIQPLRGSAIDHHVSPVQVHTHVLACRNCKFWISCYSRQSHGTIINTIAATVTAFSNGQNLTPISPQPMRHHPIITASIMWCSLSNNSSVRTSVHPFFHQLIWSLLITLS